MGSSGLSQSQPLSTPSSFRTELQNSCVLHCGCPGPPLLASQTATPCTSGSRRKRNITRNPCEPTPMKAMLTLSLGATKPTPPRTRRGTMVNPIAAVAVCPRNFRRDTEGVPASSSFSWFSTAPPSTTHFTAILYPLKRRAKDRAGLLRNSANDVAVLRLGERL